MTRSINVVTNGASSFAIEVWWVAIHQTGRPGKPRRIARRNGNLSRLSPSPSRSTRTAIGRAPELLLVSLMRGQHCHECTIDAKSGGR